MIPNRLETREFFWMEAQAFIPLSAVDRAKLEDWTADRNTPQKRVWRSHIVPLPDDGAETKSVVRAVGKCKRSVARWLGRSRALGATGQRRDASRPGRKPPL